MVLRENNNQPKTLSLGMLLKVEGSEEIFRCTEMYIVSFPHVFAKELPREKGTKPSQENMVMG